MIIIIENATYRRLSEGSDLNSMVEAIKGGPRIYLEGLGGSFEPVTRLEQLREWTPRAQNTNGSFTGAQKPYKTYDSPGFIPLMCTQQGGLNSRSLANKHSGVPRTFYHC